MPQALTVFTDGSSNGYAAYAIDGETHVFPTKQGAAQIAELHADLEVIKRYNQKLNPKF